MDISKISNIIRRYLWLFVLVTLVASVTTYFAISRKPAVFEAKTKLLVGPSLDSPSPDLNALRIGGQLIQTYAEMVSSRPFLESVNDKLAQKTDVDLLAGAIEAKQNVDTRILTIFVRQGDPNQAVAIANAIATTLVEMSPSKDNTTTLLRAQLGSQSQQLEQIITSSQTSIDELETKLVELSGVTAPSFEAAQANREQQDLVMRQLSDERTRLSETLRTLTSLYAVLRDTNANQVEIVEPAGIVYPVNQNIPFRVAAAGLAGLILIVCIVFSFEYFGDTIRYPGDFDRATQAPLLSAIDSHDRPAGGLAQVITLSSPISRAANGYRTAVAKLLRSTGESRPYSFLLSSVGSQTGEETAEIAANLGVAFTQAGKQVALIDAQFQNPQLTKLLEAEDNTGLAEFMTTSSPKLKLLPVKDVAGLRFLPAGLSAEKSASAILNSAQIAKLLEELQRNEVDIVIVSGSPIPWFAESLNLATQVNGVILVARHGEARVKIVNEVVESLKSVNANLAGVIFDSNQARSAMKPKARNVFESAPVVSEDSHV